METKQTKQQPNQRTIRSDRQEEGQAMIEMLLILPLLILIIAVVFDFGRVLQAYVVVENATREAAFAGAAEQLSDSSLQDLINAELQRGGVNSGTLASTITYEPKGSPSVQTIIVDVTYEFPLMFLTLPVSSVPLRVQTESVTFW